MAEVLSPSGMVMAGGSDAGLFGGGGGLIGGLILGSLENRGEYITLLCPMESSPFAIS